MSVAIYGHLPSSRWGHTIVAETNHECKGTRLMIFGGVNLNSFFDSSVYILSLDENEILELNNKNTQRIEELYYQGQMMLE